MSEELNKNNPDFSGKENEFSLPGNYFDSFSSRLFKKIAENEELEDYPLLASVQKKNPFTVPSDYFDLKEDLLSYPLLAENRKENLRVPLNYFNNLQERITDTIISEEEETAYALLYSHKNKKAFAVPQNYFENFRVTVQTESKVISLYKRIKVSYKIAAAIALLIGLSVLFYTPKTTIADTGCYTFACLDKKDILNSGYIMHVSDDNIIDLIDEKSLSDSLFLKKDGKTQKVNVTDVSDNVDLNTLTDNL